MKKLYTLLLTLFIFSISFSQNVNITTKIDGFRHNWDCSNDGVNNNQPDPRYKVWVGYNGANFAQSNQNPGLICGNPNYTYGTDGRVCSSWNPGIINGPGFTGVAATSINVDMESWEEDDWGTPIVCEIDNCNKNTCANSDDIRCGRLRIGDIDFTAYEPCTDHTFTGAFTSGNFLSMTNRCSDNNGAGYGLDKFIINWNFSSAPSIVTQTDALVYGGPTRDVCTALPVTVTVVCNKFGTGNWTLGRWVKWQTAPDVSGSPGTWTDVSGPNVTANTGTTFTYNFTPSTAGIVYYRAVLSSTCNSSFATQTTTSNPVKFIVHDATTDPFCTAPQCGVSYVDPTIASEVGATGSPSNPYKYISTAVTTGDLYIRVAKCTSGCTDPNVVTIRNNSVIEGGYVRSGASGELWRKSSATVDRTNITFSGVEAPNNDTRHIVAFKADNKTGWTVKDLNIVTANTPANTYAVNGQGMSNYGFILINNARNYNIVRCDIAVGAAGNGRNGTANTTPGGGVAGSGGGTGSNGNSGTCNTSNGVSKGNDGSGGTGTAGAANTSDAGAQGTSGTGGAAYGTDDGACVIACGQRNGNAGGSGGTGGAGGSWSTKPTAPAVVAGSYYIAAGQSASGGPGGGGGGGGGGSGSRGGRVTCISCDGNTGATGRTGSTGGAGGAGGYGGGGAFGIWRNGSNLNPNIQEVNVSSLGAAGSGGLGQNGRPGVAATGANGGSCNGCVNQTCSGNGGGGGAGGAGGKGRDGADGVTHPYVLDGVGSALTATIPFVSTVTLDNFTYRNNISGKMCRFSEIDMIKTAGATAWTLPAGLSFVNNLTSTTSSYGTGTTSTTNIVKVTTNSENAFYDITHGATVLTKFLYTATDARTLPAVVSSNYICRGSTIDISSNNNYDVGNIQEREYVVFSDAANANTPLGGGAFNSTAASYTTPAFNTTGRYWIRYRERHNCCGWSRPVFKPFDVIDVPSAPAAISITGGNPCYNGSGQSFTITIPGSSFAFPTYDSWELFDVDPTFGTPTPIQTSTSVLPSFGVTPSQTTTYYIRGKNACGVSAALSATAFISGDQNPNGVLATTSSSKTCTVNDALWHYFRNGSGQIIAAINSNGQNLGSTTLAVTINTTVHDGTYLSPKHGNGGIGNAKVCLGQPELSMKRWYTITPTTQPTPGNPSTIRLFFTAAEYAEYVSEIATWTPSFAPEYEFCYGTTFDATDLAVSKNETNDIPAANISTSLTAGPGGTIQYEISMPSFSTFRFHTFGGKGDALPVELVSFTGWNQGSVNRLQWITASEINSSKFEVEKSQTNSEWTYIGEKVAAGNSNQQLSYDFTDNSPLVGNNYYRLKLIDLDGTFKYSNVINIPIGEAQINNFIKVYPNPTGGQLNVDIQVKDIFDTKIMVYDVIGKKVFEKQTGLQKGVNTIQFDFSNLSKGTYMLQFSDKDGKLHTTKFVKD